MSKDKINKSVFLNFSAEAEGWVKGSLRVAR